MPSAAQACGRVESPSRVKGPRRGPLSWGRSCPFDLVIDARRAERKGCATVCGRRGRSPARSQTTPGRSPYRCRRPVAPGVTRRQFPGFRPTVALVGRRWCRCGKGLAYGRSAWETRQRSSEGGSRAIGCKVGGWARSKTNQPEIDRQVYINYYPDLVFYLLCCVNTTLLHYDGVFVLSLLDLYCKAFFLALAGNICGDNRR